MTYVKLELYKFRFKLKPVGKMNMPRFKGSMFRGAFGWALRNAVCITKQKTCEGCLLKEHCSYFKMFETEIPKHSLEFLKGVKKTPHPFVIEPPYDNKRHYESNETFTVNLIIFGDTVKLFPFFVYAFQKMGERGVGYKRDKFKLLSVENINGKGEANNIFDATSNILHTDYQKINTNDLINNKPDNLRRITLNFISPLRIQEGGKIIKDRNSVTPKMIFISAVRRVMLISHLFSGGEVFEELRFENEFKIASNKLNYENIMRYSNRQKTKMEMGGFTGEITLDGNLSKILPYLYLSEELHLGKNTVFGLGKFELVY
jgi:hypothetical protein